MGGIQKAINKAFRITDYQEAEKFADKFIKDHNLPQYTQVELTPNGKVIIKWSGNDFEVFSRAHPEYIKGLDNSWYYDEYPLDKYAKYDIT